MERRFVFLDRDGVLSRYLENRYVNHWTEFEFAPGALEALARLAREGVEAVVVSNQGGVGKGLTTLSALAETTRRMVEAIERAGGRILDVRYCVHAPEAGCACRKPSPGLLLDAARVHGIPLDRTYFVGDNKSDVQAGRAAGTPTILVLSGNTRTEEEVQSWPFRPDLVKKDLADAVEAILAGP